MCSMMDLLYWYFQKPFGGKALIKQGPLWDIPGNTVHALLRGKGFGVGSIWKRLHIIFPSWSFTIYMEKSNKLCNKIMIRGVPTVAQWVKDLALPQLWCRSQLELRFYPWPGNFRMLWVWPKKEKPKQNQNNTYWSGASKLNGPQIQFFV